MTIDTVPSHFSPVQKEAFIDLVELFKWQSSFMTPLSSVRSFDELVRLSRTSTHAAKYYAADTMRWFGTKNPHLAAPGITVENQSKAPDGVPRYVVTAWVLDDDGGVRPVTVARRSTLDTARRYARAVAAVWADVMQGMEQGNAPQA
jgi:hypothetical protein